MFNLPKGCRVTTLFLFGGMLAGVAGPAAAQTGTIEFVARVTPSGGRPEPALRVAFYLLTRSFSEIQREVEAAAPPPDRNQFVDGLEVSPQLKAWMKRTRTVRLSGPDFQRRVTLSDLFEVPEFFEAYLARNAVDVMVGFPKPKYRERDRAANPQKYERQRKEYLEAVRRYAETYAHSREGLDLHLMHVDPGARWSQLERRHPEAVLRRTLELAQTRYLAAKTETDLAGRAAFVRVAPGQYWLSTLDREVISGDVRLRWDLPLMVGADQLTRLELSNINAAPPAVNQK